VSPVDIVSLDILPILSRLNDEEMHLEA